MRFTFEEKLEQFEAVLDLEPASSLPLNVLEDLEQYGKLTRRNVFELREEIRRKAVNFMDVKFTEEETIAEYFKRLNIDYKAESDVTDDLEDQLMDNHKIYFILKTLRELGICIDDIEIDIGHDHKIENDHNTYVYVRIPGLKRGILFYLSAFESGFHVVTRNYNSKNLFRYKEKNRPDHFGISTLKYPGYRNPDKLEEFKQSLVETLKLDKVDRRDEMPKEQRIGKRSIILSNIAGFVHEYADILSDEDGLRQPQMHAIHAFYHWLNNSVEKKIASGHIILPMAVGKTALGAILSLMAGGKTICFTHNNEIGYQTMAEFDEYKKQFPGMENKTATKCFDIGYNEDYDTNGNFVVAGFQSIHRWMPTVDWSQVNLIIVDEADINALSDLRAQELQEIATKHGVPLVGMSATENQASGRYIKQVFPQEIMRMATPEAFPQLREMNLVPNIRFTDLELPIKFIADRRGLSKYSDVDDKVIENLIEGSDWNKKILEHYLANFKDQKGLVIFRNNKIVDNFIKIAHSMGIKAARFTNEEGHTKRAQLMKALAKGDIDLLIGSRLLGRGLNIPEVSVVYNSMVTYSPQLFWQGGGRAIRTDPKNPDKTANIITLLPEVVGEDTLYNEQRPLCHASFFNTEYYETDDENDDSERTWAVELKDVTEIRSIEEVIGILEQSKDKEKKKFIGKPQLLAELIKRLDNLHRIQILKMIIMSNYRVRNAIDALERDGMVLEDSPEIDASIQITSTEERQLLDDYLTYKNSPISSFKAKSEYAQRKLILAHMPLLEALAKHAALREEDEEDLVNTGVEYLLKSGFNSYFPDSKARLCKYWLKFLYERLLRTSQEMHNMIHFPVHMHSMLGKVVYLLEGYDRKGLEYPSFEEICEKLEISERNLLYLIEKMQDDHTEYVGNGVELEDRDSIDSFERRSNHERKRAIQQTLSSSLTPKAEKTLRLSFGINQIGAPYFDEFGYPITNEEEHVLQEVADIYGTSRARIQQIEVKALSKLRKLARFTPLKDFVDWGTPQMIKMDTATHATATIDNKPVRVVELYRYCRSQKFTHQHMSDLVAIIEERGFKEIKHLEAINVSKGSKFKFYNADEVDEILEEFVSR